ncbi:hypothetical protein [Modestobacter sp. I12A-02662]|uniref:hypothetical protein n=1 Tax=Modestobacter sp. I12A-02662 TaxID=1730496 RepID=UPI0034DFF363
MFTRIVVASALLAGLCVMGLAAVAGYLLDVPLSYITGDYHWTFDTSPALGSVTVLNVIVWAVAGALAFFVAWVLPTERLVLRVFGALMLVLVVDDAFMLHESVGPYALGLPQVGFYVVYACLGAGVLWLLARSAERTVTRVYVLGGVLLVTSILIDLVRPDVVYVEDTFKLLGALVLATVPILAYAARRPALSGGPQAGTVTRTRAPVDGAPSESQPS